MPVLRGGYGCFAAGVQGRLPSSTAGVGAGIGSVVSMTAATLLIDRSARSLERLLKRTAT